MTGSPEPLIVTLDPEKPEPVEAAFADVLIAVPERRPPSGVRERGPVGVPWAELFDRHPGLALAAIPDRAGLWVAARDGTLLVLPPAPSPAWIRAALTMLHLCWALGLPPTSYAEPASDGESVSPEPGSSAIRWRTWAPREEPRESKMSSA